jgi:phosphohistidine phosphatase
MHRLILLRHGKAERSAPGGDIARRLTDRGRNDAALMGRVLAERDLIPDVALVSAAARTQETWAAVSPAFPMARAEVTRDLYLASEGLILKLAEERGETVGSIRVVGHNPGLHMLAIHLLRQAGAGAAIIARAEAKFSTSSVAAFTFDEAGRPAYDGLFHASDFGGGGGE